MPTNPASFISIMTGSQASSRAPATLLSLTIRALVLTAATALRAGPSTSATTTTTTNPPSLSFSRGFAWCEMLLLCSSVLVLAVALLMMGRMYPSLSTPTKTMTCMVAANLLGACVSLSQSGHLLTHLTQGRFLPTDDVFCAASHPVFAGLEAITWWGHVLLAFATWQTIHGRRTGPKTLNTLLYAIPVAIGVLVTVGLELQAPGEVLWGLFCVTPFLVGSAKRHADIRWFQGLLCQTTLGLSAFLYAHGYWTLWQKSRLVPRPSPLPCSSSSSSSSTSSLPAPTPQQQQAARLRRATKALLHRSVLILVAYYLPYVIIHCVLSLFHAHPPPDPSPRFLALFFLAFVFGQPVLQSFILIHAAVSVGHNLLNNANPSVPVKKKKKKQQQQQQAGAGKKEVMAPWGRTEGAAPAAGGAAAAVGGGEGKARVEKGSSKGEGNAQATGAGGGEKKDELTIEIPSSSSSSSTIPTRSSGRTTKKKHVIPRRSFHDPHRGHTRTRSREQVQVLATIYEVAFKKGRGKHLQQGVDGRGAGDVADLRVCPAEREASSLVQEYLGREALPDIGEKTSSSSSSSSSPMETLGESIAEEEEEEEEEEEDEEEAAEVGEEGSRGEGREGRVGEDGDRFSELDDGGRETIFDDGEHYAVEIEEGL